MLNHCLEWDKWVLTNFDLDRQWFNTRIPPSHQSASVTVDCISRLSEPVKLSLRYTTPDIHCRNRRYEWEGGINSVNLRSPNLLGSCDQQFQHSSFTIVNSQHATNTIRHLGIYRIYPFFRCHCILRNALEVNWTHKLNLVSSTSEQRLIQ